MTKEAKVDEFGLLIKETLSSKQSSQSFDPSRREHELLLFQLFIPMQGADRDSTHDLRKSYLDKNGSG